MKHIIPQQRNNAHGAEPGPWCGAGARGADSEQGPVVLSRGLWCGAGAGGAELGPGSQWCGTWAREAELVGIAISEHKISFLIAACYSIEVT